MQEPAYIDGYPPISFCASNIDLHSLEEFEELRRMGLEPQEAHCLGLCHHCSLGKVAVCGDRLIVAATSKDFWFALGAQLYSTRAWQRY